jgi:hypothetical protein
LRRRSRPDTAARFARSSRFPRTQILRKIALQKMKDLNASDIEAAARII